MWQGLLRNIGPDDLLGDYLAKILFGPILEPDDVSDMAGYGSMASMVKVTFTLDEQTVERLRRTASRLAKPQSYVVREAVREYEARSTKLSDEERARMLAIVDRMVQEPPTRTAAEVDVELGEVRASRRRWGRLRTPTRPP